jgi:hypothetical protein
MFEHQFDKSLGFEKKQMAIADNFYKNQFPNYTTKRYFFDTEFEKEMQRKDIDISLISTTRTLHVSEKFREKDFNDIYLEFFSKYPNTVGWMENSGAEILAYFLPQKLIWIDKIALLKFYNSVLKNEINISFFEEIHQSKKLFLKKEIFIEHKKYNINIIQALNKTKDAEWQTLGISIPYQMLNDYNINYKIYNL